MGNRTWARPAMLALLIGNACAQPDETGAPPPDLLEFLGSWEQPADASAGEFIDLLDVWDTLVPVRTEDDD